MLLQIQFLYYGSKRNKSDTLSRVVCFCSLYSLDFLTSQKHVNEKVLSLYFELGKFVALALGSERRKKKEGGGETNQMYKKKYLHASVSFWICIIHEE